MKCLLLILVTLIAFTAGQQRRAVDSKNAAILQEARYLSGDGSFGSAYVQDDGTDFKEETDLDGNRKGQYSYYDPTGKKITIQYTAGKNGFQVTGDHLPKAPQPIAPAPAQRSQYQPSNNNYQQSNYQQQQPSYQPSYHSGAPTQSIPDTPEVAAARAEHFRAVEEAKRQQQQVQQQQQQYNSNSQDQYNPPAQQYNSVDDDGQYNPAYDNGNYNNNQQQQQQPPQNNYNSNSFNEFPSSSQFSNNNFNQFQQQTTTTPAPHRFFPPGKLNLNRTPDGYQYSFSSN